MGGSYQVIPKDCNYFEDAAILVLIVKASRRISVNRHANKPCDGIVDSGAMWFSIL